MSTTRLTCTDEKKEKSRINYFIQSVVVLTVNLSLLSFGIKIKCLKTKQYSIYLESLQGTQFFVGLGLLMPEINFEFSCVLFYVQNIKKYNF